MHLGAITASPYSSLEPPLQKISLGVMVPISLAISRELPPQGTKFFIVKHEYLSEASQGRDLRLHL